ncbi:AbrB/MazE/SpoVT family DNA-binding domain-containing protein [Brevibacillus sp. IT-7CA2]
MRQADVHTLYQGGMSMNHAPEFYVDGQPAKVVYDNNGQTKVTLVGRWFFMTPEEVGEEFCQRVEDGDLRCCRINDLIHDMYEKRTSAG